MAQITIVAGLGLGDEGKGTMVDWLSQTGDVSANIRFNGGPQAAHHVVRPDNRHHTFSQFGSGSFTPQVRTHLSSLALVKISNLLNEARGLAKLGVSDVLKRLTVDPQSQLILPLHAMVGQMLETARGKYAFGTVGMGVGEAAADQERIGGPLIMADLVDEKEFRAKMKELWAEKTAFGLDLIRETQNPQVATIYQAFVDMMDLEAMITMHLEFVQKFPGCIMSDQQFFSEMTGKEIVLEGAQGALLDKIYGFCPHITKTRTLANAGEKLLSDNFLSAKPKRIGVLRAYSTRHGAGPFVCEDLKLDPFLPEPFNSDTGTSWQGKFRLGWFDLVAARYALSLSEIDALAITNLDRLAGLPEIRACNSYQYLGTPQTDFDDFFEWKRLNGKICITSIKKPIAPTESRQRKLTQYLFGCVPFEWISFKPWQREISITKIPSEMFAYLEYLQSKQGLDTPIEIISVGPTANDKIVFRQAR